MQIVKPVLRYPGAKWTLAKEKHPDAGGSAEEFRRLTEASEKALQHFEKVGVLNG